MLHPPHPMVVKRDSEMYAKKFLAKTKNIAIATFYDDEEGDDDEDDYGGHDHVRKLSCGRSSKPATFVTKYASDDSD
jgi:hypothetical protein